MFQFATATKIVFGAGMLAELPGLARALGHRVWLVLGAGGRYGDRVRALLESAGAEVNEGRVAGEPTVEDIVGMVQAARAAGTELVVGVGGGSVIDAGKAIAALLANPGDPMDFLEVVGKGRPLGQPSLPFIAVPTTSGTGAEVTKNAVLGAGHHRVKVSLRSDFMLPRVALVDPELTLSVPREVTAATGLDALTQVLEPYVSRNANPLTDALSREGLSRAARSLRRAFHDGGDLEARSDMSLVSLLGGMALANAKLGAVHGFAGPIGGMFDAPHGAICARLLPVVTQQNIEALLQRDAHNPALGRYAEIARIFTGEPGACPLDGVAWLRQLVEELGIPALRDYGVTSANVPEIVSKAQRASSMQGNPLALTVEELSAALSAAL